MLMIRKHPLNNPRVVTFACVHNNEISAYFFSLLPFLCIFRVSLLHLYRYTLVAG